MRVFFILRCSLINTLLQQDWQRVKHIAKNRFNGLAEKPLKRLCQFLMNLVHLAEARC